MSALIERLKQQAAAAEEANLAPLRQGSASLSITVGEPSTFPVLDADKNSVGEGVIRVDSCRFIGAHLQQQRFLNATTREPETRDGREFQLVLDTTFVVRGSVRAVEGDEEFVLPLESTVWAKMNNPMLFIYGQHQGAEADQAEALRKVLQEDFGWVARVEREGVERKRQTVWNLQSRGPVLPEQVKFTSGAIEVVSLVVRSTEYPRGETVTGFRDFVSASADNFDRWLKYSMIAGDDKDARAIIDRAVTSLTGARTEVPEGGEDIQTFADRAGIGEFSLITERDEAGVPTETTPISMWKSGAEAAAAPAQQGTVFDTPF